MTVGFRHVAVLMGGPSAEREVSLCSGRAVAAGLREAGYTVTEVDLIDHALAPMDSPDAVFVALHGTFGEDGDVQSLLEERGIPYTGSGPRASRKAFDKQLTKEALRECALPTAAYEILQSGDSRHLPLPVVVKPTCQGSSIGIHRVFDEAQWDGAYADASSHGSCVMVEEFIPGHEFTVGVVCDEALPVIQIRAPEGWYNYDAKYRSGGQTEYLVPAPIDDALADTCRQLALETFQALGCYGFGRVDFRLAQDGQPQVLELNSIPGFTETSLLPKAAAAAGWSFSELCRRIMETATTGHA